MNNLDTALAEIAKVRQSDQIPGLLQRVAAGYGIKTVAYLATGTLNRKLPRPEPYIAVTYSSEWIERYRARGYITIDPAIQIGLRRLLPIDWDDFASEDTSLRQLFGEASEFGLGRKGMSAQPSAISRLSPRTYMTQCYASRASSAPHPIFRPGSSSVCSGPRKARRCGNVR